MRKALFFDIDGTIWDRENRIPDSTKEAFRLLKGQGHYLFLCSGRTRVFILDGKLMPLGFDGVLAGCGTYGEFHGEEKFYYSIPLADIRHTNDILRDMGAAYVFEGRHNLYLDEERFPEGALFPKVLRGHLGEKVVRITGNEDSLEVSKFCVNYMDAKERQQALEQEIGKSFSIIHRDGDFMEVVPKGFNKATGIQKICEILGVAHEDTYSFGDSTNDLDMLSYTAHSVAMGDGMQQAKDVAEYVTSGLWEDGIYQGCKHYGLI